ELLRLPRDVGGGERVRGEQEPGQDVDAVAHDQFLREPFRDVGRRATDVSADDLDRLAGDGVAVLLHVGLDAVVELDAGVGELAGENVDQPDLDGALRARGRDAEHQRDGAAKSNAYSIHSHPPGLLAAEQLQKKLYSGKFARSRSSMTATVGTAPPSQPRQPRLQCWIAPAFSPSTRVCAHHETGTCRAQSASIGARAAWASGSRYIPR